MIPPRLPDDFRPAEWSWYDPKPYSSSFEDDRAIASLVGDTETVSFIRDGMAYTAHRKRS